VTDKPRLGWVCL